jgi:hypothetical protein
MAACGDEPPPTQIIVVTATPPPDTATSPEANPPTSTPNPMDTAGLARTSTPAGPQPSETPAVTITPRSTVTPTPTPTMLPAFLPTNVVAQVQIAEQVFEHGRMNWLRHNRQIWVTLESDDDPTRGDWFCYNDTFQEGEPEIDPDLIPPENLFQPRRGFGKLWRNTDSIREGVGWATTPEFELTSTYMYIAGGPEDENGELPPGEHRLTTLYNDTIIFYEQDTRGDCMGGLWRLGQ